MNLKNLIFGAALLVSCTVSKTVVKEEELREAGKWFKQILSTDLQDVKILNSPDELERVLKSFNSTTNAMTDGNEDFKMFINNAYRSSIENDVTSTESNLKNNNDTNDSSGNKMSDDEKQRTVDKESNGAFLTKAYFPFILGIIALIILIIILVTVYYYPDLRLSVLLRRIWT